MNLNLLNLKVIIGILYITIISLGLYFLFSAVDIKDLTSYEFIKINKDIILEYKNDNFLYLTTIFFIFVILWVALCGFAMPLLIFSGFVFGKYWGLLIILVSTTIGATLLYMLAGLFFRDLIEVKLAPKFSKLRSFFQKNDIAYFMFFRFIGGGGAPYAVQNVLPILFNMSVKNFIIATVVGSTPSMFVTVAIGSGIESIIDKNEKLDALTIISSPEIYLPIIFFFILLSVGFFIKKRFFK
ncbi:VTT domain-containing protein [Pelagibacteraceae bacterium]|nr:VTT domain-containing protein [Pelagibacteraceae bacterium]